MIGTIAGALAIAVLAALLWWAPPDGAERAAFGQFIGAFHPLAVHLPIALLLLAPVLELAGRAASRAHLRASARFVLGLGVVTAIAAPWLGWLLARYGGYEGVLLVQHMWAGIALAAASLIAFIARDRLGVGATYSGALALVVALVAFTGYRGGQIAHGENHLIAHMPERMRNTLGLAASRPAPPDPTTFFGAHIAPVLAERCVSCHGESKQKGSLRLDSFDTLLAGGKSGPALKAGDAAHSELFHRITLPPTADDAMPPEGKTPLTDNEIRLIELWIAQGASPTLEADAIPEALALLDSPSSSSPDSRGAVDPQVIAQQRAQIATPLTALQARYPHTLSYESRASAALHLNASLLGPKFGDADLAALAPVHPHIVWADLSGTAITDASAAHLANMKALRTLRLARTRITDATARELRALSKLESLNLFAAPVSDGALEPLSALPHLARVYVGRTRIDSARGCRSAIRASLQFENDVRC